MNQFSEIIEIDIPATAAWDVLADYGRDAEWRGEVISMVPTPPGPSVPGTTTVEVAKLLGSTFETPGEVVAVEAGRRLAWRAGSDAVDVSGERIVEDLGGERCRVTLTYDLRPKGTTRLLAPALTWALRRAVRSNLRTLAAIATPRPALASRT